MRAAIYARLSMDREGTSNAVDRQVADCRELCEARGLEVVQVFSDNDVSAYVAGKKRLNFELLLRTVAAGDVDTVVVWKTDRLARRGRDLQKFLDTADPHGVTLTSCTEPEFSGPTGKLMLKIISGFAEHESDVKAERVARANKARAAEGKPHGGGGRKFGYTEVFHKHPVEAPLIVEAANRLVYVGDSGRTIARDWNDRRILTVAGVIWSPGNFKRMMRAPLYAGLRSYHGELHPGTWPALIERAQWDVLQVILTPRPAPKKAVTRHLLSGLCRCACGARMFGVQTTKGYVEYRCSQERGCGKVSIRSKILEPEVERQLFEEAPRIAARQRAPQLRSSFVVAGKLRALDADVEALDELSSARYVEHVIDHPTFLRRKAELDARIDALRASLAMEHAVFALNSDLEAEWSGKPLEWKRQVLEAAVDRITVRPGRTDRISIEWAA